MLFVEGLDVPVARLLQAFRSTLHLMVSYLLNLVDTCLGVCNDAALPQMRQTAKYRKVCLLRVDDDELQSLYDDRQADRQNDRYASLSRREREVMALIAAGSSLG